MSISSDITADAIALQERDEFRSAGWLKLIAPAKVNLYLAIGERKSDGYHDAATVLHAVNLHDVVYLRWKLPDSPEFGTGVPAVRMVPTDPSIEIPEINSADNLATRAIVRLARELGLPERAADMELRIEKSIPAQAGLGGGSTDAAAALVGAACLWSAGDWELPAQFARAVRELNKVPAGQSWPPSELERVARSLGADVPFFLRGGSAYYEGRGDEYIHALDPLKQAVVLVKPAGGVSTAAAYRQFDADSVFAEVERAAKVQAARAAGEVDLFNNLAPASEVLMPELRNVRAWLKEQPGVVDVLLSGSGAASFALCEDFSVACAVVSAARRQGWWARATSLGSARVLPVPVEGSPGAASGAASGAVSGAVPGTVSGAMSGAVSGAMPGTVLGTMSGAVSGAMPGAAGTGRGSAS